MIDSEFEAIRVLVNTLRSDTKTTQAIFERMSQQGFTAKETQAALSKVFLRHESSPEALQADS